MEILSHRGYWKVQTEKNTVSAFIRAFENGFGLETDLRDLNGELVISHDPPSGGCMRFEEFARLYRAHSCQVCSLALNVKADGLQQLIDTVLKRYEIDNYFVFDMSGPDTLTYLDMGLTVFTRQSEIEPDPICYDQIRGVWIDCFYREWIEKKEIIRHVNAGKKVCLVSPELHRRPHDSFWHFLKKNKLHQDNRVMLCTDFPQEAKDFFHG